MWDHSVNSCRLSGLPYKFQTCPVSPHHHVNQFRELNLNLAFSLTHLSPCPSPHIPLLVVSLEKLYGYIQPKEKGEEGEDYASEQVDQGTKGSEARIG